MSIKEIADVLYAEFEKADTILSVEEVTPIEDEEIINISINDAIDAHRVKIDPYDDLALEDYIYGEVCQYIEYILKGMNVCADLDLAYDRIDDNIINVYGTLTIE